MNQSEIDGSTTDTVNIEHVMQEVRREILDRKLPGQVRLPPASAGNQRPEYYEELFRAALAQSRVEIDLLVTPSRVPIVGPLIDLLRGKFHELVVFYINRSTMNQAKVNSHILAALSILGQAEPPDNSSVQLPPETGATWAAAGNQPAGLDDVRAAYRLFLGRRPQPAELEHWTNLLTAQSMTRQSLIDSFLRRELPDLAADRSLAP
ncbi:MAG: hypothetical protein RKP73_08595 [Candidatus Contendobacter sp.]|nr:hypothetical protein [Candidatus Contendobacter sp.]RIK23661.1 MAG: hypothetical protein DCC51_02870 [Anaerolineae bacterium]